MLMRIIFLLSLFISWGTSQVLQKNQTIIIASNSTFEYAKACFKMLELQTKNNPIFILKAKSGHFMVTTGIYNNKEEVYAAMKKLPQKLQEEKPFRSELNYELTSKDERILYANHLPKEVIPVVKKEVPRRVISITKKEVQKKVESKPISENYLDSMYLGFGQNWKNNDVYRVGLTKNFQKKYFESDTGYISGYYDLSLSQIEYSKNIYAIAFSPVWAYYFNTQNSYTPYIYGGIGGALISDTTVQEKNFSTSFQFEDRVGVGLHTNRVNFTLGYIHYSNADIKKPNSGMDMGLFSIHYNF